MRKELGYLAVAAALLAVAASWGAIRDDPAHDNAEIVARGKTVYDRNCASCHGADLAGAANWRQPDAEGYLPAPPHDATGHTWHHPDPMLFVIVKYGSERVIGGGHKSRMPGFGNALSDDEIAAVLAYIKSTWPAEIAARQSAITGSAAK